MGCGWWGTCASSPCPHPLGSPWGQLPAAMVALALITPKKLLHVRTQFAVTQTLLDKIQFSFWK